LFIFEHVNELEHNVQQIVIEKFLSHSLVQGMLPNYLLDMQHVKYSHDVVSNMKSSIIEHLANQQKSQLVVAMETICMLASSSSIASNKGVTKLLSVDKCNIRKALKKLIQLDTMKDFFGL
jgi:hypothetical protein